MIDNLRIDISEIFQENIVNYFRTLQESPLRLIILIIDISIVIFLTYALLKTVKDSRAWQLLKGIAFLIIVTVVSGLLQLKVLNFILTYFMSYGFLILIVIFQPELRRALEQLGTNRVMKYFGINKDIATRTKEDIYKAAIAIGELAKTKTGALIVMERDIEIKDITHTGIELNSEVSPQLLVNIFTPNTPLHDGAVIISKNKISAAACMLPLAGDADIAKELGTRHRAAIGISKESDAIAIVVSEETGKVSVAKDGTLIADVKDDVLKKILIKNIVTNRLETNAQNNIEKFKNIKLKLKHEKKDKKGNEENEKH